MELDLVEDFPILKRKIGNNSIVYLDNAATTFKPTLVIDSINAVYNANTANVFRGDHLLSEEVSLKFENVRRLVSNYINADYEEIVFTSGATDSINKVSSMLNIKRTDNIVVSLLEHHSNFLPWKTKCNVKILDLDNEGVVDLQKLKALLCKNKVKLVAITLVSNVTGNIQPVQQVIKLCHERGVLVLVDASQAIGHMKISVKDIGCDFLVFSAHKMLGPSGVGILYIRKDIQKDLSLCVFGGGMVDKINDSKIAYKPTPFCFEAGTPPIEQTIGLGAAIEYINNIGINNIYNYMKTLNDYCFKKLKEIDFLYFPFAINNNHVPIFTFLFKNKNMDIKYLARIFSCTYGIAMNAGYQCCQPLYNHFGVEGAIRCSLYIYNTKHDVDRLVFAINDLKYLLK